MFFDREHIAVKLLSETLGVVVFCRFFCQLNRKS